MDENAVRAMLERAAESYAPRTVDIAKARRVGRRHLRLRSVSVPAAGGAAAAAIAALTLSGVIPIAHHGQQPTSHQVARLAPWPATAPTRFTPLAPYVSFGRLPPGYRLTAGGIHGGNTIFTTTQEGVTAARGDGRRISLGASPAGRCHLTGPTVWPPDGYANALSCGSTPLALVRTIPGFRGGRAYWAADGSLVFRYAPRAWAEAEVGAARPQVSQATKALLVKVASHAEFGVAPPLAFPFQLHGMPATWHVASTTVGVDGGRLAGFGMELGPSSNAYYLGVYTMKARPGLRPRFCDWTAGQSQRVSVDGTSAILRTMNQPDKYYQSLCFEDFHGLTLLITTDPGKPAVSALARANEPFGVLSVILGHLRVLGPDPAHWTTDPLG